MFSRKSTYLAAVLVALALQACGGGGSGDGGSSGTPSGGGTSGGGTPAGGIKLQVVSFGDSLSDVGTYAPIASGANGGRFTTNPGQVWTQNIAQYYGDTLTPAFTISLTHALSASTGRGYAEGGSTVATPAIDQDFLLDLIGNVEMPMTDQVTAYLQSNGSFNANQLVLIWIGANDVLRAGTPPAATPIIQTAASTLSQQINRILQNGASHVVVLSVPDVGVAPKALAQADHGANLSALSQSFNASLKTSLSSSGASAHIIWVDTYAWLDNIYANYASYGFTVSNTATACDLNKTPNASSLMCSPSTYVTPNADQTYMFADTLHLTTHMHTLLAQYVEQQIAASGLGH